MKAKYQKGRTSNRGGQRIFRNFGLALSATIMVFTFVLVMIPEALANDTQDTAVYEQEDKETFVTTAPKTTEIPEEVEESEEILTTSVAVSNKILYARPTVASTETISRNEDLSLDEDEVVILDEEDEPEETIQPETTEEPEETEKPEEVEEKAEPEEVEEPEETEEPKEAEESETKKSPKTGDDYTWDGPVLTARAGRIQGPSGEETYYNLDMSGCIKIMKELGFDYEYSVREDGVKLYGGYVMVAANLSLRPKGTIVETSLGLGIVVDTGDFAADNPTQLDIAVTW